MLLKQGKYFEVITRHTEERSCGGPITTESILPQQAREAGISLNELFDNAIELALTRPHF